MRRNPFLAGVLLSAGLAQAGVTGCPAGLPIGNIELNVKRADGDAPLPLRQINRIEEGDRILYSPALKRKEKRSGKVALVLVASKPPADAKFDFEVLEPRNAALPAEWKVPFRSSLAVYVYGPDGLSVGKVRGFLAKDEDLMSQLADYAEKTAQTETVLQALNSMEAGTTSENLNAAITGFARSYGVNNQVDRNAPLEQQTLAVFRNLNPALATYDPISPSPSQRLSQTAGLATTVAAMFFGNSVGLAAGGAALGLNLKTLVFPNTDFRSSYAQFTNNQVVNLCGKRDAAQGRTRLAYLWGMRVPDARAPKVAIESMNHVAAGAKNTVKATVPDDQWKLVSRVRDWALVADNGERKPVQVAALADQRAIDIVAAADLAPGKYNLAGRWDWDPFAVSGDVYVHKLSTLANARLKPDSRNRLQERSGKQVVTMEGEDFEFVNKVTLVRKGDKYGKPVEVPFSLPSGLRHGPQDTLEMEIDTTSLPSGEYALLLQQVDGKPQTAEVKVLPPPPRIEALPITVPEGEAETTLTLRGEGLDRLTALEAEGFQLELDPAAGDRERKVKIIAKGLKRGAAADLRMTVRDFGEPVVSPRALQVGGRRPRIVDADLALPAQLPVSLRPRELPAGLPMSAMLKVQGAAPDASVRLGCRGGMTGARGGADSVNVRSVPPDRLFVSFDPGQFPSGCTLTAVVENGREVRSVAYDLGRVVRAPAIDSFRLTDESSPEGGYFGILTGRDLELIEKAGWDAKEGYVVTALPAPVPGEVARQTLKVRVPWPSPAPHAPLYIWLRGEEEGRATTARY